jgi:dihydrofolate synthase/folylpolyglutamate synthase
MPVDELAQLAEEIFGEDRVTITQNMPDAIEEAVVLAEENTDGEHSGVAVLITGSIVTVADARKLLKK